MRGPSGPPSIKMGTMTNPTEPFDHSLDRLETLVQQLESGALPLEAALERFEEGIALTRALQEQLSEAQRRVEVLKQGLAGEYRTEPLEGEDA